MFEKKSRKTNEKFNLFHLEMSTTNPNLEEKSNLVVIIGIVVAVTISMGVIIFTCYKGKKNTNPALGVIPKKKQLTQEPSTELYIFH